MEILQFYQEAFMRSAEKLISIEAETRQMLERLANEKRNQIAQDIIGKEYNYSDLFRTNDWNYKHYKGHVFKAVLVETTVVRDIIGNLENDYGESIWEKREILELKVYFMRNPLEVLSSNKNLTGKEKDLLRELSWWWKQCKNGNNPNYKYFEHRHIYKPSRELDNLKNKLYMVGQFTWSYDFKSLTSDNFLNTGLRSVVDLC